MVGARGRLYRVVPVRVAVAIVLAGSLAACTALTSLSGLEGPGSDDGGDVVPNSDGSGDDSLDTTSEGASDDSGASTDVAVIGDANMDDAIGDTTHTDSGIDDVVQVGDVSSGEAASQHDTGSEDSASPDDVTLGDSAGDASVVRDASPGDSAGDVLVIGDASPSDSAADRTVPGDAGVDGMPSVDAAPSTDSATPPVDATPPCTQDASTDPNNCGSCGHSCQGGTCTAGLCGPVTLATTHGSLGIADDFEFLYWADNSDAGAINKVSKALTHSGTPSAVVTGTAAQGVQGVATDEYYIYWTNKTAGQVHRALPTGAGLTTMATGQSTPDWIASNGTIVAWTNQGSNQVMSLAVTADGGVAPTQLNLVNELGTTLAGIAIDTVAVYYATKNTGGGLAEFVPVDGGTVTELGTGTYVGIATDTNNVYWTGGFGNPVVYQNAKSGTPATVIAIASGALVCPLSIASDGTNVYFIDQGTAACAAPGTTAGALYRVPVGNTGPLPAPLVTGLVDPQGIVVDGTAVYWVTGGTTGAVMKLAK